MTFKLDRRATCRELTVGVLVRGNGTEAKAERRSTGVCHLRGQRALPDQGVERELLAIEFVCDLSGAPHRSGWSNRLMCFLSVLRLRGVSTRLLRQEGIAVCRSDDAAGL